LTISAHGNREDAHASAFHADGALAYLQGNYATAEARHREALAIWTGLGNRAGIARSLNSLGNVANSRGELAAARRLYEDAVAIAREIGDRRSISMNLHALGMVAHVAGDYAEAQALLEECAFVSRDIGAWRAALALSVLGDVKRAQGDFEAARCMLLEALKGHRELGDKPGIAKTLVSLAIVSHEDGDIQAARLHLMEALDIMPTGDALCHVTWLDAFAGLSLEFASATSAARLWGCTERLREEIGSPLSTPERARHERLIAAARSALHDDAAFERAWNEGRSWTLDQAVSHALDF
jgi:tetratricopeptide (TPR) repeat protein